MDYPTDDEVYAAAYALCLMIYEFPFYPDQRVLDIARGALNAAANLTQNPITYEWLERDRSAHALSLRSGEPLL